MLSLELLRDCWPEIKATLPAVARAKIGGALKAQGWVAEKTKPDKEAPASQHSGTSASPSLQRRRKKKVAVPAEPSEPTDLAGSPLREGSPDRSPMRKRHHSRGFGGAAAAQAEENERLRAELACAALEQATAMAVQLAARTVEALAARSSEER